MKQPSKTPAAQHTIAGKGGETHQVASGRQPLLTTDQGIPVSDDQNSLKAGAKGPTLLEDFVLREKITHFDHERIPERIVHARGSAAHGYFECTKSLSKVTRADFLQRPAPAPPFSRASRPWPAAPGRATRRATCAVLR